MTAQGTILGTLQYMSPEQLEGRDADARTDIFAFGEIVYEMVTGRKVFEGKSQASLIAAILERQPALMSSIQPVTPQALERVVQGCLEKDPEDRWQRRIDSFSVTSLRKAKKSRRKNPCAASSGSPLVTTTAFLETPAAGTAATPPLILTIRRRRRAGFISIIAFGEA